MTEHMENTRCPKCGHGKAERKGCCCGGQRYRCLSCGFTASVRTWNRILKEGFPSVR